MPLAALDAVSRDWADRARRAPAAEVLAQLLRHEPELAATGAATLEELVGHIGRPPAGSSLPHWRVTAALIRRLELDEVIALGLITALRPGLLAVARQLDFGRPGWESRQSFAADLVTTTWDVLQSCAGSTLSFPERTVLRRVRQRLEVQRRAGRRRWERERPQADLEAPERRSRPGRERQAATTAGDLRAATLPTLDALAIALSEVPASLIAPADVAVVYRHRVLGYSLREIAAQSHQATTTVRLRCRRAEEVLCAL